jgi:hypothetical protein
VGEKADEAGEADEVVAISMGTMNHQWPANA